MFLGNFESMGKFSFDITQPFYIIDKTSASGTKPHEVDKIIVYWVDEMSVNW